MMRFKKSRPSLFNALKRIALLEESMVLVRAERTRPFLEGLKLVGAMWGVGALVAVVIEAIFFIHP